MSVFDDFENKIFPGGREQVENEICELAQGLNISADSLRGTYVYARTGVFLGGDRETLLIGIKMHNSNLSAEQLDRFAKFVFRKDLLSRLSKSEWPLIDDILKSVGFVDIQGEYDEIPGAIGEFGLDATNPVPVNGIPANEKYLQSLQTAYGSSISWKRRGSLQVPGFQDPVDLYDIVDGNGKVLQPIYISPYHPKTSKKAPKGYRIINN